ncbi:universal stress protein [Streptomyces sp. NPDC059009]|uniref:universal stress protein n=1 Tax=Streptomyces sp. NPDC059009 TaxID=3346694 RepID=UPI0036843D12
MSEPRPSDASSPACDASFRHGVVVGFDGSTSAQRALAYASGMARRTGSGLIVVHVPHYPAATAWGWDPLTLVTVSACRREHVAGELAGSGCLSEVTWTLVERDGGISHTLEDVGREYSADAIVVGATHSLRGRILGSVAGRLTRRARRLVIVVP